MGKEQEKAAHIRRLCAVGERHAPSLQIPYHKTTNGTLCVPFQLVKKVPLGFFDKLFSELQNKFL
ncbi:hypothetical protein [Faecousia sp.]|uniref:hypothetical protein n=1 Tax=Faecousia sp. TaxID=2952921 RepID=UPI003AB4FC8C